MPHPSPRNNIWLSKNLWFEKESLPLIQQKIELILNQERSVSRASRRASSLS
jgi:hypothetical protein